ncbi:MAG: hypothetical protein ACR2LI_01440 [Propionibacteriaceae bacterium]
MAYGVTHVEAGWEWAYTYIPELSESSRNGGWRQPRLSDSDIRNGSSSGGRVVAAVAPRDISHAPLNRSSPFTMLTARVAMNGHLVKDDLYGRAHETVELSVAYAIAQTGATVGELALSPFRLADAITSGSLLGGTTVQRQTLWEHVHNAFVPLFEHTWH